MSKPTIVAVTEALHLQPHQIERLEGLGNFKSYKGNPTSKDDWLNRAQGADILCAGRLGLDSDGVYEIENVYISMPAAGYDFLDLPRLREKNVTVSNSPGCNKKPVAEWIITMLLLHFRRMCSLINITDLPKSEVFASGTGLHGKNITILGKGNIGGELGKLCEAFDMNVRFFTRGDELLESVQDADIIANCLSAHPTAEKLLDQTFFQSLKPGSFFISIARSSTYDIDALLHALDAGILSGAADDAASAVSGDQTDSDYLKFQAHPKVLATPHLSWNTDVGEDLANTMMIDNIEAWIAGKPINVVT